MGHSTSYRESTFGNLIEKGLGGGGKRRGEEKVSVSRKVEGCDDTRASSSDWVGAPKGAGEGGEMSAREAARSGGDAGSKGKGRIGIGTGLPKLGRRKKLSPKEGV